MKNNKSKTWMFKIFILQILVILLTCVILFKNNFYIPKFHLGSKLSEVLLIKKPVEFDLTKLMELRSKVRLENLDEFVEIVLKEIPFEEIDFFNQLKANKNFEFDQEIQDDFDYIDPDFNDNTNFNISLFKNFNEMEKIIKNEGFNWILSKMISPNRTIPDSRPEQCKNIKYDVNSLPTLSVIVPCHNEPLTTLMRTLHSVVNRTPVNILKEIIIVDDESHYEENKQKMERYILTQFNIEKIRLVRLKKRAGLIKARMIGAHLAIGDVLIMMDSHSEVENFWAEPILKRIQQSRTSIVTPTTTSMSPNELFYYSTSAYTAKLGFYLDMIFKWIEVPMPKFNSTKEEIPPVFSPVMMGAAIGVERKYFWEIGSFDPGMETWGGENLEISFRNWQCGGSVEVHPCSRVGHLFRSNHTYGLTVGNTSTPSHYYNSARMAHVWMDEFKEMALEYLNMKNDSYVGDISRRVAFRQRLNCKSFKWYLDNVYKEKFRNKFHPGLIKYGRIKSLNNSHCLDTFWRKQKMGLNSNCKRDISIQVFYLTDKKELMTHFVWEENEIETGCVIAFNNVTSILVDNCSKFENRLKNQWEYNVETKQLTYNEINCLTATTILDQVKLNKCNSSAIEQKWDFL